MLAGFCEGGSGCGQAGGLSDSIFNVGFGSWRLRKGAVWFFFYMRNRVCVCVA